MDNNTILMNDSTAQTLITIKLDNKKINHSALNRFLIELEELSIKYSMAGSNDVIAYVE